MFGRRDGKGSEEVRGKGEEEKEVKGVYHPPHVVW
jgi:hypothetical protein